MIAREVAAATQQGRGHAEQDTRPIMYVGTLVADERSLKELERKLQIVRMGENQRKGGSDL